ncbi:MAG: glycine/betaine/sarcosine/D-proline family reductase selenoprotein B, partial [Deltaproteobacteria bacterium]|nr:glycine/betaine/sarcosine/D-proline family reductase selenoprotein B [Deltaproteobacteria bacterium]
VMRALEAEGVIGKLHTVFYSTAGTGTYPEVAMQMAREITSALRNEGAEAAILTAT